MTKPSFSRAVVKVRDSATSIIEKFFGVASPNFVTLVALAVHRFAKLTNLTVDTYLRKSLPLTLLLAGVQSVRLLAGHYKIGDPLYAFDVDYARYDVSTVIGHAAITIGMVASRRFHDKTVRNEALRDARSLRAAAFRETLQAMSREDRRHVDAFCAAVGDGVAAWRKDSSEVAQMLKGYGGHTTALRFFSKQLQSTIKFRDVLLDMIHEATSAQN